MTVHIAIGMTIGSTRHRSRFGGSRHRLRVGVVLADSDITEQVGRVLPQDLTEGYRGHILVVCVEPGTLGTTDVRGIMPESKFCTSVARDSKQAVLGVLSLHDVSSELDFNNVGRTSASTMYGAISSDSG
jgi:hypothetical protein